MFASPLRAALRHCGYLLFTLASIPAAQAQPAGPTLDLGLDLVSRYVWRGMGLGNSPSVQPTASLTYGGFEVGTWGNYALASHDAANASEHDFWAGYTFAAGPGSVALLVTDYYYPGAAFFDWQGAGDGSHTLEASLRYAPTEQVPLYVLGALNVFNDTDRARYVEVGYDGTLGGLGVGFAAGAVVGASGWYGVDRGGVTVVNTAIRLGKEIPFTAQFSLPVAAQLVLNPYTEQTYFVVGFTL